MDEGPGWEQQQGNEEEARWNEEFQGLLKADPDYERWVEASYGLHIQEQGETDDR